MRHPTRYIRILLLKSVLLFGRVGYAQEVPDMGPASPPGALAQARSTLQQQHQPAAKAVRTAAPGATIPEVTIPKGTSVTLKAASTWAVSYQRFRDGAVIVGAWDAEFSAGLAGVLIVLWLLIVVFTS